jgi:hypothetical protein
LAAPAARPKSGPKTGRGAVRVVLVTLFCVVVLGIAAYLTQPYWRPQLAQYLPFLVADDAAQLRLYALDRRLAALESQAKTPATPTVDPNAQAQNQAERAQLQARIEKLEAALESVRATATQGATAADEGAAREALRQVGDRLNSVASDTAVRIDRLARQIETIEQSTPPREDAEAVRNARLVFAIGRLRDAVLSTHPFRIELAALKTLSADDAGINQALDRLSPRADSGVPTADLLRQRFRPLASAIVNAGREPVSDSWIDRSMARVLSAINIRRTDDIDGGDVEAIVARAEKALERNDIQQAAQDLRSLPERAAPVAKPWLADAEAHLVASNALVDLQTRAFAELGVKRGN